MALANIPQTLTCYRLELEHFGNAGRWGAALQLLSELKKAGLTPDAKVRAAVRCGIIFRIFSFEWTPFRSFLEFFFRPVPYSRRLRSTYIPSREEGWKAVWLR